MLQVRLLLAKAATEAEDWHAALTFVTPLAVEGYASAWPIAAVVACSSAELNSSSLQQLLAFSIAHCGLSEVCTWPQLG